MSVAADELPDNDFTDADLTGARFLRTRMAGASIRMSDLSGVTVRDACLSGASIDGCEIDGLVVNGVEVGPLVEAELVRREPARGLRRSSDPAGLQAAWAALEDSWAAARQRVEMLPDGSADVQVAGEWSFAQTLRHLVFVTDGWLGAARETSDPFHRWGMPFSDAAEFLDGSVADLGIEVTATPSYREVLEVRADRVQTVRQFLAEVPPDRLAMEVEGPPWDRERMTALRCLWVLLNEECEHLRFAQRDLAVLESAHGEVSSDPVG